MGFWPFSSKKEITLEDVQNKEKKCGDKYDDFILCTRHIGFNDIKCRRILI